jgi:hypothetical protein
MGPRVGVLLATARRLKIDPVDLDRRPRSRHGQQHQQRKRDRQDAEREGD